MLATGQTNSGVYTVQHTGDWTDEPRRVHGVTCWRLDRRTVACTRCNMLATGQMNSGVYTVYVNDNDIDVYCDMSTDAGGWLVSCSSLDLVGLRLFLVSRLGVKDNGTRLFNNAVW